jgi:hypothetical protein
MQPEPQEATGRRREQLATWTAAAVARFDGFAQVAALWRFVDAIVAHRAALRKEAPDLDADVGGAAHRAYERITGYTLVGVKVGKAA